MTVLVQIYLLQTNTRVNEKLKLTLKAVITNIKNENIQSEISFIHLLLNKLDTTCGTQHNKHETLLPSFQLLKPKDKD